MFSLLGFQNVGGEGNHDFGGPFCHFGYFFILRALMMQFVYMVDRVLSLYVLLTNSFILADFLQPWRV